MTFAKAAVSLAALILLFGCAAPTLPPIDMKGNSSLVQLPKPPKANDSQNATNESIWAGENETAVKGNGTGGLVEPTIVPRNVSDKIYEGQFDLPDPSAAPLKVRVIDAGYADAVLVNKGEFNMLIDDGNPDLVHAYLKNLSIGRLDVVVATKDDPASFSGISAAMDEFSVGELWDNGNARVSGDFAAMRSKAASMGIPIKHPRAGDRMEIGGMEVYVLNPQNEKQNSNPDNDAIVLKIQNNEFCMVLLNPIVQDWENSIITAAGNESIRCDVMTYFKHGEGRPVPPISIEKIEPRDVIISVGPNSDGLPSPTTLTRLQLAGKHVWRTDTNGTIEIVNFGHPAYEITLPGQNATKAA